MKNQHGQGVLIIGGGPGGCALLSLLNEEVLFNVLGIVDNNADAPGLELAKNINIPIYADIEEALEEAGKCLVLNMTHNEGLSEIAARWVGSSSVLGGNEAKTFWQMISRMQTMQAELWENQARMQAVLHNVREGIISIDIKGCIEDANPAAAELFGYTQDELIGKNVRILMPEPQRSMHDTYLRNYHRTGQKTVIGSNAREMTGLHKNGYEFSIEINVAEMDLDGSKHFVGLVRDITERKLAEDKLTRLALYDQMTGLPNRTMFYRQTEFFLAQAKRIHHMMAILFIDLDGFKSVNDTLGHDAGDLVLKAVGKRLHGCIRDSDIAARMGGDEFTVILNNIQSVEKAGDIARKIIDCLNQPIDCDGTFCNIGASIGIAVYPNHADNIEDLVKRADSAMYQAKNKGKNTYVISGT